MLEKYITNLLGGVRYESLEGRDHVVAPVVMLCEGVVPGSAGPLFYPGSELGKNVQNWNLRPITVYHPVINGQGVSACDPIILTKQKVGVLLNTSYDTKLRSQAWIDIKRADEVDPRIMEFIRNQKIMEVSTGLFTTNHKIDPQQEHNGRKYDHVARDYVPDHLALLPDCVGACSIADGAGLLQNQRFQELSPDKQKFVMNILSGVIVNEMSFSNLTSMVSSALRAQKGDSWDGWVEDLYTKFAVYRDGPKLFRVNYSATDTKVELEGDAEEVRRVTEYRTVESGAFVGNDQTKENEMNKAQMIAALISNTATAWTEADRATLEGFTEAQLQKMQPVVNATTTTTPAPAPTPTTPAPAQNQQTVQVPVVPQTVDQYIASAPPVLQTVLRNGLQAFTTEKARLIGVIKNSPGNMYSDQYLESFTDLAPLQGIVSIIQAHTPNQQFGPIANGVPVFAQNYQGASLPTPTMNNLPPDDQGLPLPKMEFAPIGSRK